MHLDRNTLLNAPFRGEQRHMTVYTSAERGEWGTMPYRRQFYIPALDGLRAFAVLAVFAYHLDERRFPGGFLGVDLFFVISGYVITLGLLDEWQARGSIDLRSFWWRRVRRLMPAAVAFILVVLGMTALFFPERMAPMRGEAVAALAYVSNWYLVFAKMPYFETISAPSLLRHLWSLAVEEQFYLLWPPMLVLGLKVMPRRQLFVATVALAIASAVLMTMLYRQDASADRLYYGTDTRGFALLGGAALAFVCKPRATRVLGRFDVLCGVVGALCVVVLAALGWVMNGSFGFVYEGGLVLAALASIGAVTMCARADNAYTRFLESPTMRWLGTRSYSAYLWHWPVVLLLQVQSALQSGPIGAIASFVAAGALTLLAAEASYRWIEMPFREGRVLQWAVAARELRGGRRGVVFAGGMVSAFAVLMLSVTVARARMPEPPPYLAVPRLNAVISAQDIRPGELMPTVTQTSTATPTTTPSENTQPASIVGPPPPGTSLDESVLATPTEAPRVVVPPAPVSTVLPAGEMVTAIGDSVMLGSANALARALGVVDLDAEAGRSASAVVDVLRQRLQVGRIGSVVVLQIGDNGALRSDRLDEAFDLLQSVGVKRIVVVNLRVPRAWEAPNNALLSGLVSRHSNAVLVDWHQASAGRSEYLYDDQIHLTPEGAALYASLIADAIRAR